MGTDAGRQRLPLGGSAGAGFNSGMPDARGDATPSRDELSRLDLFANAEIDQLEAVLRGCPMLTLAAGDVLMRAGERNTCLHLLLEGELRVHLDSTEVAPLTVLHAGQMVGEVSVVDRKPATAYVVAGGRCRVLQVDEELLWMLADSSHAVAYNLLHTLASRLREDNKIIRGDREQLRKYMFHASVDALTGLFNRFWLRRMLDRQMERARTSGEPLGLLMVDADHFKAFNDTHGHVAGDHALRCLAGCMRQVVRPTDMLARYGGEEFAVLLPGATPEDARAVAERLRARVAATPITYSGRELPALTVSIGIAQQGDIGDGEAFVEAADRALYRAKAAGRNRIEG